MAENQHGIYHRSPLWRIGLFSLNNSATNIFHATTFYVSFYAVGIVGLATVLVGNLLMAMRIFDGITDPLVGYLIDKTDSKFGKFRPFLVIGFTIMTIANLVMYTVTHTLPEGARLPFFVFIYALYILGYTCSTAVTKAAQNVMTNDPSQRPLFGAFDGTYTLILFNVVPVYVSMYLLPKNANKFTIELFREFIISAIIISGILTVLVIIALWEKDRSEFFGLGSGNNKPLKFKDYWDVLKNNRGIQMLIVAASTDKLALTVAGNSIVTVMLYGIIMGDNTLHGKLGLITLVPSFILIQVFAQYARKLGIKRGIWITTTLCIIMYACLYLLLKLGDPTQIRASNMFGFMTLGFIILWSLSNGIKNACGALTINAISDVADYETYRTGRYVPGMMGTLFSFVDKLISSLGAVVVSLSVAAIGYTNTLPQIGEAVTPAIFRVTMFLFIGIPILGWIASLIALLFYPLSSEKMQEIQEHIAAIKNNQKKSFEGV
ncbi:MFS transporter [Treponema phagedenis]|uniref:MFS transporter n=1 Tax=Treponema phagedenis TaxID=162 RepID=UPI0011EF40F2|nr:MFS transporter [Treponema phagedenis]TYT78751.1 glucuronide permease [Treponema phagedenis]